MKRTKRPFKVHWLRVALVVGAAAAAVLVLSLDQSARIRALEESLAAEQARVEYLETQQANLRGILGDCYDGFFLQPKYQSGQEIMIEWHGTWYPGVALESRAGFTKIHFDDHEDYWDEWVVPERIKLRENTIIIPSVRLLPSGASNQQG